MEFLKDPVVALFLSLAFGHLIGKLRVGPIALGGICGTLFVALLIGQLNVTIDEDLKNTAFALFIFALGFTAGPQFFANIKSGWRYGIFSIIEVVSVLAMLAIAVIVLDLDPGTTAGLFAGSATESAVIGTASEALARLDLPAVEIATLQANVATAYSVTYLFGLVAIVIFTSQIAPLILGVDLRKSAQALAENLGSEDGDAADSGPTHGFTSIVGRAFRAGPAAGMTVGDFERSRNGTITVLKVRRADEIRDVVEDLLLQENDILLVRGRRNAVIAVADRLGEEVAVPADIVMPMIERDVILSRKDAHGRQMRDLRRSNEGRRIGRGVVITRIRRLDQMIPALPKTVLQKGDVLTLNGGETEVTEAASALGTTLTGTDKTDFIFLGLGIVCGLALGKFDLKIGALDISLGMGGGALVAGLVFGWLHMHFPRHGTLPVAAAEFVKDFGLATFIAAVGLSAGPSAVALLMEYGLVLPVIGLLVSFVPALISLLVGWKLMKIEPPILLGAIAGQHCSTPTISALVSQAGNGTPVIGYTVTYAFSNVLLPLMGPLVVAMATALYR
ncbi:aspartate-alanine antiporter [Pararhizobium capsulatum DSM 1112]|uniref:Aspartate-alanine antiporter n=1 Tax=Pararhizobium capsulatum DSM 1112 TaxID=1121113 RepID=A0ABU0BR61_9HYPH|nr:aspartate-alanine antiporter [Pararhizobium capsulatum]MDQ0320730.1 aspartate-alanine antiporter [Pararhizobium capsulatum DSM 1112]